MRRLTTVMIASVAALLSSASLAASKMDDLVACMWQQAPTSTAQYLDNADQSKEFPLFMKSVGPCGGSMTIDLKRLKRRLAETRPAEIGPDIEHDGAAFACDREGKNCNQVER